MNQSPIKLDLTINNDQCDYDKEYVKFSIERRNPGGGPTQEGTSPVRFQLPTAYERRRREFGNTAATKTAIYKDRAASHSA